MLRVLVALILMLVMLPALATPSTSYYIYDESGHVIGEYDANGNPVQEHIYLGDNPVAVVQGGTVDTVATDQLNTPRAVMDANKNVIWSWNSDPFGNGQPTGSLTYNLRFPGQYFDSETVHNYNHFRDYDPATGRYIQSDPIGLPGGLNTYGYGLADPISNYDPSGKSPGTVAVATDIFLGGPENPVADGAALVAYVGSALWAAYELNQSMHNELPCDREKECAAQLERDYEMCDALARASQKGKRPSDAYARCISSAHQRHANCLRGRDYGTLDTWNN